MANKVDKPPPLTNEVDADASTFVQHIISSAEQHVTFAGNDDDYDVDPNEEEEDDEEEDEEEEDEEYDPCLVGEGETEEQVPLETISRETSHLGFVNKRYRRHHFIKHEICVPDKTKKFRPPPHGRPWYLQKKKTLLEKRQDSAIVFVMPKQEDPEVIALRKTNKMVQKLIKYMKKSWKVRLNHKQEDRELEHRSLVSVYTRKPDNWLDLIRRRENRALETGFFSAMDVPYDALVDLELDTALLTFKNLPADLKITAARWIRTKLRKEELKKKRDAFLPRLPHGRTQRPSYNKGRLIKDPGGALKVDQFVRVAEGFQRVTKGNTTFSKALKEWSQKKEKESNAKNSGFGIVREGMFDFLGKPISHHKPSGEDDAIDKNNADQRRVSIVDARKYQRDMLYFAKVLGAMYDVVKSLLNIKMKQLESKLPLPPSAVLQIRAKSPDHVVEHKSVPWLVLQRKSMRRKSSVAVPMAARRKESADMLNISRRMSRKSLAEGQAQGQGRKSIVTISEDVGEDPKVLNNPVANPGIGPTLFGKVMNEQEFKKHEEEMMGRRSMKDAVKTLSRSESDREKVDKGKMSIRSSAALVKDLKRQHSFEDLMDFKQRPSVMLTAEQKIKRLAENPDHAAIRRARNYMTYTKLFERNRKLRKPVWHNIDIAAMSLDFNTAKVGADKDPANLTEADAAEIAEKAMQKRRMMSGKSLHDQEDTNKRWPEEYDIPTPTYPFPRSVVKIPSEEQSRRNLLKKTPHIDEVPSTPVRRLYKLAGVRTVESDIFNNIMEMKKMFRVTENKLRVYYENEIGKWDWDTLKRFRGKLNGIKPFPVYYWTINAMRSNHEQTAAAVSNKAATSNTTVDEEQTPEQIQIVHKRPALWFKHLQEDAESNGATRHNGCYTELQKLRKYCDVDMKTKPYMLNRLALLTVSLPTTELGTKHWQQAIVFLLEHMCGTPPEIIHEWLKYRCLPYLL